ncbi:hypothetical protein T492DRAFT_872275 [Pavlovales sp. CCMP2436]|nr:hypothetical protein T492DRAFT_872275 [Pavlovales sp. CCMP2436]
MTEALGKTHRCGRVDGMRPLYLVRGGLVPMAVILDNLDLAGSMGTPQGVHVLAAGAKALVTPPPLCDGTALSSEPKPLDGLTVEARRLAVWEMGSQQLLATSRLSGHGDVEPRRVGLEQLAAGEPFEPRRFVARRVLKVEDQKGPVPVARSAEWLDSYYPPIAAITTRNGLAGKGMSLSQSPSRPRVTLQEFIRACDRSFLDVFSDDRAQMVA